MPESLLRDRPAQALPREPLESNHRSPLNKGITMSRHPMPVSRPTGIPISFSYISLGACSRAAGGGIFERSAPRRENL